MKLHASSMKAYSLIELLFALAILGILFSLSIPDFSTWLQQHRTDKAARQFLNAIILTRATAIRRGQISTFCRSDNGQQCQGQWHEGALVFVDYNANAQVDPEDEIIYRLNPIEHGGHIRWRVFQNKQYLQMTPLGFTNYQNGNFTFCPPNNDITLAQQIVVNRTGRARVAIDTDGDGIKEGSNGRALNCS